METTPALREMVVVGHSQGGLLTKLTVVDSGLAFWREFTMLAPDELQGDPDTLDMLKRSLIFTPEPFVKRVVFLCTPQHGSFLAAMSFAADRGFVRRAAERAHEADPRRDVAQPGQDRPFNRSRTYRRASTT
jgi:hypothetical protein